MISLSAYIYRGNLIESKHEAICLVQDTCKQTVISTDYIDNLVFPRSAIKIFQALPFVNSGALNMLNLNKKNIAMACSSHSGESYHLIILKKWLDKTGIAIKKLLCGIHNPLDEKTSNKLLLSGKTPSQLHNNCSGKHLGMISGCIANKMDINKYVNFNHPYQKLIRNSLENFMESSIKKKCFGIDGCSAPQYAFPLKNISTSMINLIKEKETNNENTRSINLIINSINKFPFLIGSTNSFDSDIIKFTKGRIFCKRGAEGILLFADFKKKIGGVIKIIDGNNRAIPSITMQIFSHLKMLSNKEKKELSKWKKQILYNHSKKNIGKIVAKLE